MMPSLDRVGRCFPLVLAAPLTGAPLLADCLTRHAAWFVRLEEIALSSLDDGFALEAFDAALLALAGAPSARLGPALQAGRGALGEMAGNPAARALVTPLSAAAGPALRAMDGASAWWGTGSAQVASSLAQCRGLPAPALFSAMLDGAWRARGWQLG